MRCLAIFLIFVVPVISVFAENIVLEGVEDVPAESSERVRRQIGFGGVGVGFGVGIGGFGGGFYPGYGYGGYPYGGYGGYGLYGGYGGRRRFHRYGYGYPFYG